MKQKENDLRYQKTEKLIRSVFYQMIDEMDYNQITVKELSQRAEINRKTFYLHYLSLDVLLAEIQAELISPLLDSTITLRFPRDLKNAIRSWFLFSASLGKTESRILSSIGNYPTGKNPWEYAMNHSCDFFECFSDYPLEKNLITAYWCGSFQDIFTQWIADGKKIPIDNIIRFFYQIMSQGLINIDLSTLQH